MEAAEAHLKALGGTDAELVATGAGHTAVNAELGEASIRVRDVYAAVNPVVEYAAQQLREYSFVSEG